MNKKIPASIRKGLVLWIGGGLVLAVTFLVIILTARRESLDSLRTYGQERKEWNAIPPSSTPMAIEEGVIGGQSLGQGIETPLMRPAPEPITTSDIAVSAEKIIKTGSLAITVESVDWSAGEIGRIVSDFGGLVDSSTFAKSGRGTKSGTMVVRVPSEKFDEVFARLKQFGGTVTNESISGTDVTEQVIDLEARLKNKQAEEAAYANILQSQAQKVSDVLEVTRALNTVRGEIESLQGQLKYLNSQADMATITLTLSEDQHIGQTDTTWRPWQVVKDSVNGLLLTLQSLADFFIRLVIIVLPIALILGGLLVWFLWWLGKKVICWLGKM